MPGSTPDNKAMPWNKRDFLNIVLICLGVATAIWRLWQLGVPSETDMLIAVYRAFILDRSFAQQVYWPRMALDSFCGYGGPLFQYYPPLVSYIALVFHWIGLGFVEALKAVATLSLFLAGLGSYVYTRWLFGSRLAALVAGMASLFAPYLLLDIFERGAVAELLALAILPWAFWAAHRILRAGPDARLWGLIFAALVASLVLAHNITALFAIPLLLAVLLLFSLYDRTWGRLPLVFLAAAGGLMLSAFYWMPALSERALTQLDVEMLSGSYTPVNNLRALKSLVQSALVFDYWGESKFTLALWQAAIGVIAVLAIVVQRRELRWAIAVMGSMMALLLLLQSEFSRPFWSAMPLVSYVQFSWRLLGLTSLFAAWLAATLFLLPFLDGRRGVMLAAGFCALIFYAGLLRLDPKLSPHWHRISSSDIDAARLHDLNVFTDPLFNDFLPVSMTQSPCDRFKRDASAGAQPVDRFSAPPTIRVVQEAPFEFRLGIDAPQPFTLGLPRTYFPNWQARVDGAAIPTGPHGPEGLVAARIPAGLSEVVIRFEDTPPRRIGTIISVVSVIAFIVLALLTPSARLPLAILASVVALSGLLMLSHQGFGEPPHRPTATQANFDDTVHLLGYELPEGVWRAGDTMTVRLYWLPSATPESNTAVFLHVVSPDDSIRVAQADSTLLTEKNPPARWQPGEIIVEERTIELASDIPPGRYDLLIGLYNPESLQNLPVRQATEVWPGDRVNLGAIEIQND